MMSVPSLGIHALKANAPCGQLTMIHMANAV